MYNNNN